MTLELRYALLGIVLIAPAVTIFAAVIAYPLVSAVYNSLFAIDTLTLQGHWVGFGNYLALLQSRQFWAALYQNAIWTAGTVTLQLVLGVAAALLLNTRILFRSLARGLLLFPYFISSVVAVLIWRWLFNDLYGILNHALMEAEIIDMPIDWLGQMPNATISVILVGTWKHFPFVVIAVLARLQTIPPQLYEAAAMDGASAWGRFCDVTLPQLRDVLAIVVLLRTIWDFKEFDIIFLTTGGGPLGKTQTIPLLVYQQAFGLNQMGMASATAVVMMGLMLVFIAVYLVRSRESRRVSQ